MEMNTNMKATETRVKPEDLGYNITLEKFRQENHLESLDIGRIITEHKERYIVRTVQGEIEAEITGNMRYTASSREDFPAVGDWVTLMICDQNLAIIHRILPRSSLLKRKAAGHTGDIQVIAANIDVALLIQAADRDFNINRLERYLTLCHSSNVIPAIVLTKTDLISTSNVEELIRNIKGRIKDVPVFPISNKTKEGYEAIDRFIQKGKTYCMLGSSGVGKSTLLNNLARKSIMKTASLSQSTNKGKHTTSRRELIILDKGGILIDNPGMREVGLADTGDGLETTFDTILQYSTHCKFKDCTHTHETGCAVINAVQQGEIDRNSYHNYLKMVKEKTYIESTAIERKRKEKIFGKILKNYKKTMKD